jgi:hypothetical protein
MRSGGALADCFASIAIPICSMAAAIASATGDTHGAWTQLAVVVLCTAWALALIACRLFGANVWRR